MTVLYTIDHIFHTDPEGYIVDAKFANATEPPQVRCQIFFSVRMACVAKDTICVLD